MNIIKNIKSHSISSLVVLVVGTIALIVSIIQKVYNWHNPLFYFIVEAVMGFSVIYLLIYSFKRNKERQKKK